MKFLFTVMIIVLIIFHGCSVTGQESSTCVTCQRIFTVQSLEENKYEIAGKELYEGIIIIYGKGDKE